MPAALSQLRDRVRRFPSALLGYSGGVDSALLAVVLRQELGADRMVAGIGRSASYPAAQYEVAREVASRFDIPLLEVSTGELEDPDYLANRTNRCFHCKTELWARLGAVARERGLAVVCDGSNADDLAPGEHRPGYAAGVAAGVRSPLAEVGMTKAEVRSAARALAVPVWDAPAAPCLSSRVQYGVRITPGRLRQVEAAEAFLRTLGVAGDLRGKFRWSHAFIGAVGAPPGSAHEKMQLLQPATLYVGAPVDGPVVSGGVGRVRFETVTKRMPSANP